jgi:hypothetical protein
MFKNAQNEQQELHKYIGINWVDWQRKIGTINSEDY